MARKTSTQATSRKQRITKSKLNKVSIKNTNPMKKILVANHTKGLIIVLRSSKRAGSMIHQTPLPSLNFPPGTATKIDIEIWEGVKASNNAIRSYLQLGLLKEVQRKPEVVATIGQTSNPIPPEHLQTEKELKNGTSSTRVEREIAGEITI